MKPIAILHVLYRNIGHTEYEADDQVSLDAMIAICREEMGSREPPPFCIEWLDRHNPREVTNESEAGDE